MKNSLILMVTTASFILSVMGKIPDYIQVCKRNDPQINKCVWNSITSLRETLTVGIPELNVPSIDPLHLDELVINLGPGFGAVGRDLELRGGRNFEIHDVSVDLEANTHSFTVTIGEVIANGTYEIDAKIASIPLRGKGPLHLIARSIRGQGTLRGKLTTRRGISYNWFPSMTMKLEIGDYNIRLENLFQGDPAIGEVTNKLLNEEKTEVLASFLPGLEKALVEHILLTANSIAKTASWNELFPES